MKLISDANLLNNDAQNALSKRKMVAEYQLKQAHLAFFIGKRINPTDNFPRVIDLGLTELSEEMTLFPDASTGSSAQPKSPPCNVYQYAPRYGYTDGNDLMLVFLTRKPNERINGSKKNYFSLKSFTAHSYRDTNHISISHTQSRMVSHD